MTYANVMSTLAVFLLVAGGGAIAAGTIKLKKNSVKSKHIAADAVTGDDANEATFGKVPSAGTADTAGTANIANGVVANAISAGNIQDPSRTVSLPLGSFRNASGGGTAIDADSDDVNTAPDFDMSSSSLLIVFDDDLDGPAMGSDESDSDTIVSTLTVPPDYAANATLFVATTKDTNTNPTVRLRCNTTVNGGGIDTLANASITTSAFAVWVLPLNGSYSKGDAVDVRCHIDNGSGGDNIADYVELRSVEFRYTATQ